MQAIYPLRRRMRGASLLEGLVAVAIIGVLGAFIWPQLSTKVNKTQSTVARAQMEVFAKALDTFNGDVGRFPTTEEGLQALFQGGSIPNWSGPYMAKELPADPWGHPYQYRAPGNVGSFELTSLGKDGKSGGSGEDADIVIDR